MYCQGCGAEIQPGLSYCKRCGAQVGLAPAAEDQGALATVDVNSPVRWLAATVCLTMLFGFIILFTAVGALANRGLPVDPLVIISALGLCGIFVIELSLIRIISRLLFEAKESLRLPAAKASGANELGPASAPHLVQPAITTGPIHSVTDHTTRTLGQSHGGKSL